MQQCPHSLQALHCPFYLLRRCFLLWTDGSGGHTIFCRWKLTGSDISAATGRSYRRGISNYSHYQNIWTKAQIGIYTITVNDN